MRCSLRNDFEKCISGTKHSTFMCNYKIEEAMGIQRCQTFIKSMSAVDRSLVSQVIKVAHIVSVVPATNSIS